MAFSKIELTFINWTTGSPAGTYVNFKVSGVAKNEHAVLTRYGAGQFAYDMSSSILTANNYKNAWLADYAGTSFTVSVVSNVVIIQATYGGAVFEDFETLIDDEERVTAVITNEAYDPLFELTEAEVEEADTDKCTTVKVTLTGINGTPPYTWNTVLPGNVGLVGANVPRVGGTVSIEVEDDNAEISTILVNIPDGLVNSDIDAITIVGDPSGLFGSVTVTMKPVTGVPLVFEYSLDGVTYQSSNVFNGILVGSYTMYVRDAYGCILSSPFEVSLEGIRPPAYSLIPKSNSFGWQRQQAAAVSDCSNPFNSYNAQPNNYKPTRWYNPKYFQPWCAIDVPTTQFRSNYDTLTATLIKLIDNSTVDTFTIVKKSSNLGQRQIMDAVIYERNPTQTGIYWLSGNIYDTDQTTVIDTYDLAGQLPEWVKVGQVFSLSGSAADGLFEIKQIIFDSTLLVNAAIIDRVYTDVAEEVTVKVDAVYNKLNYETYEFDALLDVEDGCYKIILSMTDSEEEYPDDIWETFPFVVQSSHRDTVYMESWDHVDDGILYSTGIVHKQRFQGLFFEEDFPSKYETSRDSRKALNKLDGRVEHSFVFEAIDVQKWVHEKIALFISKNRIRVNNIEVQFEEPLEVERFQGYARVNLKGECFEKGYEQYITNSYDIL